MLMLGNGFGAAPVRVAPQEPWDPVGSSGFAPTAPTAIAPIDTTPFYLRWYVLLPVLLGGAYLWKRHQKKGA